MPRHPRTTSGSPSPVPGADAPRRPPTRPYVAYRWPAGAELEIEGSRTARAPTSPSAAASPRGRCSARGRPTLSRASARPLAAGDVLAVGGDVVGAVPAVDLRPWTPPAAQLEITVAPGPRAERFATLAPLFAEVWTVSTRPIGWASVWTDHRSSAPILRSWRARACCPARSRCPGRARHPRPGRSGHRRLPGRRGGDGCRSRSLGQARPGTRLRFRHAGGTSSRRF
jgi:hypothetical protein